MVALPTHSYQYRGSYPYTPYTPAPFIYGAYPNRPPQLLAPQSFPYPLFPTAYPYSNDPQSNTAQSPLTRPPFSPSYLPSPENVSLPENRLQTMTSTSQVSKPLPEANFTFPTDPNPPSEEPSIQTSHNNKEGTFAETTGQKVGKMVTRLLNENPQWEQALSRINLDSLLEDPNSFIYRLRDAYQQSRVLKFVTKQFSKQIIKALPNDMEPEAARFLEWLNTKEPSRINAADFSDLATLYPA